MAIDPAFSAIQFATRFLLPFRFDGSKLAGLKACLRGANWCPAEPDQLYREDFHDPFLERWCGAGGDWNIFQYDVDETKRRPGTEFQVHFKDTSLSAELVYKDGRDIEVFVTPQGTGVVSFRATLAGGMKPNPDKPRTFDLAEIKTFNYRLAQSPEAHSCAQLAKTSGHTYAPVTLKELLEDLILPIRNGDFGYRVSSGSCNLIPFCVVRFSQDVKFSSVHCPPGVKPEDDLAAQASMLAQAAEAPHPLPTAEDPGALVRVFHTDELFAASGTGGAVFVCDVGTQFDKTKLKNRLNKYFLCYLTSLMQRLRLLALLDEAGEMASADVRREPDKALESLQRLRRDMLTTVSRSDMIEISARDVVNRFFVLCQRAHGVPRALALVQQTVMDLDSSLRAEHQAANLVQVNDTQDKLREIAEQQGQHTARMAETQNKVEWIEVFIVSFYAAELMGALGHHFHLNGWYVGAWTVGAMLTGGLAAAMMVRPWETDKQKGKPPGKFLIAVLGLLAVIGVYLAAGQWVEREPDETAALQKEVAELRSAVQDLVKAAKPQQPAAAPPK